MYAILVASGRDDLLRQFINEGIGEVRPGISVAFVEAATVEELAPIAERDGVFGIVPVAPGDLPLVSAFDVLLTMDRTLEYKPTWPELRRDSYGGFAGNEAIGYPELDGRTLQNGTPPPPLTPSVQLQVMNMSLGPRDDRQFKERGFGDLVQWCSAVASSRVPVVISAGNASQRADDVETMNAWAEPPWTIGVGATTHPNGGFLAPYSSVGTSVDPRSGPDVVAFGGSALDPEMPGTSFAAPRVVRELLGLAAAVRVFRVLVDRELGLEARGVPLLGGGWIDADFNVGWERPGYLHADALPLTGPNPEATGAVASALRSGQIQAEISARTDVLTAMLFRSARPLPDHLPHQAGFGFVNPETTRRFVTSLSSLDLVRLTTAAPDDIPEAVSTELGQIPAFSEDETLNLMDVAVRSALIFGVDVTTGDFLLMSDTIRRLEPSGRMHADRSSVPSGHRPTVTAMFTGEERVMMPARV